MIYCLNEKSDADYQRERIHRKYDQVYTADQYRARKQRDDEQEQRKDEMKKERYNRYNNYVHDDGSKYTDEEMRKVTKQHDKHGALHSTIVRNGDEKTNNDNHVLRKTASGYRNSKTITYNGDNNNTYRYPDKEDKKREKNAQKFAKRNDAKDDFEVRDTVNRNMRRHPERWDGSKPVKPKTESTIFDNIEII